MKTDRKADYWHFIFVFLFVILRSVHFICSQHISKSTYMPCFYTGFTALSEEEFQHHGQHRCSRPESISHYQPLPLPSLQNHYSRTGKWKKCVELCVHCIKSNKCTVKVQKHQKLWHFCKIK